MPRLKLVSRRKDPAGLELAEPSPRALELEGGLSVERGTGMGREIEEVEGGRNPAASSRDELLLVRSRRLAALREPVRRRRWSPTPGTTPVGPEGGDEAVESGDVTRGMFEMGSGEVGLPIPNESFRGERGTRSDDVVRLGEGGGMGEVR